MPGLQPEARCARGGRRRTTRARPPCRPARARPRAAAESRRGLRAHLWIVRHELDRIPSPTRAIFLDRLELRGYARGGSPGSYARGPTGEDGRGYERAGSGSRAGAVALREELAADEVGDLRRRWPRRGSRPPGGGRRRRSCARSRRRRRPPRSSAATPAGPARSSSAARGSAPRSRRPRRPGGSR